MQLLEMKWPEVAALSRDVPVVIPIAAMEQHGRHMPLYTDSLLLGEVVRRADAAMADRVAFAPLMWLGNSHHHLDFAGTISAAPRVYLDLLADEVECFLKHGFRRIVLLNGHGGNITPAQQAIFELRQRHRETAQLLLLSTTYWTLGSHPPDVDATLKQRQMGHACEWETSMMLRIAPHLVGEFSDLDPVTQNDAYQPVHRAWLTQQRSRVGHIGDPRQANAEKGESLLKTFTADVVALLERVAAWDGADWNA